MKVIPETVRQFLVKHIHSVDALEILLLLRQQPDKEWGPLALSRELRTERTSALARLQMLSAAGMLSSRYAGSEQTFRYQPSTPALERTINELAKWYSSHRVAVIALIYSDAAEKLFTGSDGSAR
ncbi:MAG TPA: hypothetical protein VGK48_06235 [Terriglobia bacterium]